MLLSGGVVEGTLGGESAMHAARSDATTGSTGRDQPTRTLTGRRHVHTPTEVFKRNEPVKATEVAATGCGSVTGEQ
jgi:hypothetical protein